MLPPRFPSDPSLCRAVARTALLTLVAALGSAATGCAHFLPDATLRAEGSRGGPSKGWLAGGIRLPEHGRGYTVLRTEQQGGQHWGTDRLVALVRRTAGALPAPAGAVPLVVGDLSGRGGGQVPRHQSHRCGRDVDLLFFTRDGTTGEPVPAPGFVRYNHLGASVAWPTPLVLDVDRTWNLVETLIRDANGGIIRIFIAAWIKHLLLDWAHAHERPAWVIQRAEDLLVQPGDSLVHDDHMHVRVACTPQERARGCIDGGPLWSWLQKDWEKGDSAPASEDEVLAALDDLPPGVLSGPPLPPDEEPATRADGPTAPAYLDGAQAMEFTQQPLCSDSDAAEAPEAPTSAVPSVAYARRWDTLHGVCWR